MDTATQIKNRADEYAKRMLLRQREQNMSPENQSKSLRRRISIMDALKKSYPTSPSNLLSTSNPFAKEFTGVGSGPFPRDVDYHADKSKHDGIDLSIHEDLDPTPITSSPVSAKLSNISGPTSLMAKLSVDKPPRRQNLSQQQQQQQQQLPVKNLKNNEEVTQEELTKYFTELAEKKRLMWLQPGMRKPEPKKPVEPKKPEERLRREEVVAEESRFSLGEYFHGKREFRGEEIIQPNFKSDLFEEEFRRNDAELRSKGADAFFAARVLEVIEPDVVLPDFRESIVKAVFANSPVDLSYVKGALANARKQAEIENSTVTTKFNSEEMRQLDKDVRLLEYENPVLMEAVGRVRDAHLGIDNAEAEQEAARMIDETPKRVYPDLTSIKRMSENFTPKKLFHANQSDNGPDVVTDTTKNAYRRPSSPERETFFTPMPIPDSQMNNLVRPSPGPKPHDESGMTSFLKRNTSFLNNLSFPKIMRRKPNLESTRKNEKTFSPMGQGGSTISTLTLNTPGTPRVAMQDSSRTTKKENQSQQVNNNAQDYDKDATIPYEVENFLELALGDEQYNDSVTYANPDAKASVINVSELISEDRTPVKQRIKVPRVSMTEPPKHSSTLNRTLTLYKTFTQRIKDKFRGSVRDVPSAPQQQQIVVPTDVNPNLEEAVKELLEKVKIQQTRISQASKALELCTTMREFSASAERVESERILMIAQLRSKAYLDEIGRLTSHRNDDGLYCERGQIIISSLSVQLREEALRRDYQGGNFVEWFVLVITVGPTVWATIAVPCPITGPRMYFPGTLSIPDLSPDFKISAKIYSMKMQNMEIKHDAKYHITRGHAPSRQSISMGCPSPKRLLRRAEKKTSPKQFEVRFSGIKESSFALCGSVELFLHDLNLKSPWPLSGLPQRSMLHGTIDLDLTCHLQLSVSHSGFLTHSDDGLTSWNRRWCVLEDRSLLFWNYPPEQEYKPPLYTIDLECCVSRRIKPIDRSLCPRARTFAVQTMRKRKETDGAYTQRRGSATVIRHLLSCDTNQELTEWQSKLNHVVSALREWNIINEKLLLDVDPEKYYKQKNTPWM